MDNLSCKEKYIITKRDIHLPVSIRSAKIISFDINSTEGTSFVNVKILSLVDSRETIFSIGDIYEMEMWDFFYNYEGVNRLDLITRVL